MKLIVFLRSMKISLEEIKKSIYQCIADWEKDGRYNHVAFVVASGSKISSGYDDVTIAQHTSCLLYTSFACMSYRQTTATSGSSSAPIVAQAVIDRYWEKYHSTN